MEKAIKKAIEGGWTPNIFSATDWTVEMVRAKQDNSKTLIDPLFWQALGKQQEWPTNVCLTCGEPNEENCCECCTWIYGWQYNWHRFIDHLASGNSAESFFDALLNTTK